MEEGAVMVRRTIGLIFIISGLLGPAGIAFGEEGATASGHWAFEAPQRPALPAIENPAWVRNPVDRFVLARLEANGLEPATEADRYRLIRRVSLDLTGLPPTPKQVERFIQDDSPTAYTDLVNRLLDSPRFGERWAQLWLDLARYADSRGYEKDRPRTIWRYRDWVIDALNADMPYDRFTIEQLAGDLLPDPNTNQILATAFHRNTMTNDEGGTDNEEFRVAAVKDRVDTTIQVWMGLTMACAKCHTHKYDPISHEDYYRFYALFNQTADADRGNDGPKIRTPTDAQRQREAALKQRIRAAAAAVKKAKAGAAKGQETSEVKAAEGRLKSLRGDLKKLRKAMPTTPIMRRLPEKKRRETQLHRRGNFLDKGETVEPAVLEAFGPLPAGVPRNRLGVAKWLMHPDNPLTARVAVNRFWARLFGIGLVETEGDFGTQGEPPSHPKLLDWLAVHFREDVDWSMKGLLRTIVTSAAYRQSARITDRKRQADPRNRLISRGPRFRLPAETIRDQALAAAGLLSDEIGGPSVMPPQPPNIWQVTYSGLDWKADTGEDRFRRGLYTFWRRTSPYPAFMTFDATTREVCALRRVRTNTPLQALVTLNDPAYMEAAGGLAARMMREAEGVENRIRHGFRLMLTRPPKPAEVAPLRAIYEDAAQRFERNPSQGRAMAGHAPEAVAGDLPQRELAAWTVVANVLLNLDETVTKP